MTPDNHGQQTPGVDGVAKLTPQERRDLGPHRHLQGHASPGRRGYWPRPGTTEPPPWGSPTRADRTPHAWVKHVWEPAWEAAFEPTSAGVRPGWRPGEAIGAIEVQLTQKPTGVLAADIATGFDRINHEAV